LLELAPARHFVGDAEQDLQLGRQVVREERVSGQASVTLDEDERRSCRGGDCNQFWRRRRRLQRRRQRLVLGGRGVGALIFEDPARGVARAASAAGQLQPPVPVGVEDLEYLITLQRRPAPP